MSRGLFATDRQFHDMSDSPPGAAEFVRRSETTRCAKGLNRSRGRALRRRKSQRGGATARPVFEDELHSSPRERLDAQPGSLRGTARAAVKRRREATFLEGNHAC